MTDLLERQQERAHRRPTKRETTPPVPGRAVWVMIILVAVLFGVAAGVGLYRGMDRVQEIQELRAAATVEWYETHFADAMRHEAALVTLGAERVAWYEARYAEAVRHANAQETLAEQRVDWYQDRYADAYAARVAAGG